MTKPEPEKVIVDVDDSVRLTVARYRPEGAVGPVVLLVPAMGATARFYDRFARELSGNGITVAVLDLRGQGDSEPPPGRTSKYGYRELVQRDLPAAVAAVRIVAPGKPLFILGHSMGGQLALLHLAWRNPGVNGLILVASGSMFFRAFGWGRRLRYLVGSQLAVAVTALVGFWPGDRIGFGGRQPRGVMRDWAWQVRTGRLAVRGDPFDYERALRELRTPVLAVTVEGDHLAPPTAVAHLVRKLPRCDVRRHHYSTEAAGGLLDHFRWAKQSAPLARHLVRWMLDNSAGSASGVAETAGPAL
jgi:predicted alpha/beta hydrolase